MSGYPNSMSECERNGIFGHCDIDCEVFLRGECESEDEMKKSDEYLNSELYEEEMEELQRIEDNKFKRWDIIDI